VVKADSMKRGGISAASSRSGGIVGEGGLLVYRRGWGTSGGEGRWRGAPRRSQELWRTDREDPLKCLGVVLRRAK
jgi:hypothetical protein